jgi:hypothetical protein
MFRILLSFALLFTLTQAFAQSFQPDTLTFMSYNVLRYGQSNQFCNMDCKNSSIKTIVAYAKPDLIGANEIAYNNPSADQFLNQALNVDGVTHWKRTALLPNMSEDICNIVYYNSKKIALKNSFAVANGEARLNLLQFYHQSDGLGQTWVDTVYFYLVVAHLKAGSNPADEAARASETQRIVAKLKELGAGSGNVFMMGDLNVKGASEVAFKNLIEDKDTSYRFVDPINQIGEWSGSSRFAAYHTQSTRSERESDGGSNGGCDDRFDFILHNTIVQADSQRIRYQTGTYTTIGNDGRILNKAVTSSTAATAAVRQALYRLSDHLPVTANYIFNAPKSPTGRTLAWLSPNRAASPLTLLQNPVREQLAFQFASTQQYIGSVNAEIIGVDGQLISQQTYANLTDNTTTVWDVKQLPVGIYFLQLRDANGQWLGSAKFVKAE